MILEIGKQIFAVIGFSFICYLIYPLLFAMRMSLQSTKNFIKIYGKNSWVVVTGGSDGIGLGFCEAFAELGFNICLIARNEKKLENTSKYLAGKY